MTHRITVPEEHVAVVLPREAAHRLNSLLVDLRQRARRSRNTSALVSLADRDDSTAVAEFILSYADGIS